MKRAALLLWMVAAASSGCEVRTLTIYGDFDAGVGGEGGSIATTDADIPGGGGNSPKPDGAPRATPAPSMKLGHAYPLRKHATGLMTTATVWSTTASSSTRIRQTAARAARSVFLSTHFLSAPPVSVLRETACRAISTLTEKPTMVVNVCAPMAAKSCAMAPTTTAMARLTKTSTCKVISRTAASVAASVILQTLRRRAIRAYAPWARALQEGLI